MCALLKFSVMGMVKFSNFMILFVTLLSIFNWKIDKMKFLCGKVPTVTCLSCIS